MLDAVIVGGGPAGLSTALHLQAAAPGARLVVLEKARYPREKICAGGIGARAFKLLDRIGVAVDCPRVPLNAIALRLDGQTVVVSHPGLGVVVRRVEFDHALARVAIGRGIAVRDGCGVAQIETIDRGMRVRLDSGEALDTRVVVGADGVGGVVRRQAGFPRGELRAQVVEVDTEAASVDLPRDTIVFDFDARDLCGYAWDFPTVVDGKPLVCRGVYVIRNLMHDNARARIETYLAARGLPVAGRNFKQFAERGWEPAAEIAKPRVLLVGEAAGIDIATGEGIGQAIEYGAIAGPYLADALARDALAFTTWRRTVARHHLGRQLAIRHGCYRAFYGARRPAIERLLPAVPALLRVGVHDFAGAPLGVLGIVRGIGQLAAALVRRNAEPPQ